jgi:phosphatidylglycerophosphatase A
MPASTASTRAAYLLATWFGCGRVPIAPGTAGTLGALPLYFAVRPLGPGAVLGTAMLLCAVGVWSASVVCARSGQKDPQFVVIDEATGVLIALAASPPSFRGTVAAVVLFRLLDQLKPWPANAAERRLPGGWGVVFDDVFAGAWAALGVAALRRAGWL